MNGPASTNCVAAASHPVVPSSQGHKTSNTAQSRTYQVVNGFAHFYTKLIVRIALCHTTAVSDTPSMAHLQPQTDKVHPSWFFMAVGKNVHNCPCTHTRTKSWSHVSPSLAASLSNLLRVFTHTVSFAQAEHTVAAGTTSPLPTSNARSKGRSLFEWCNQ